MIFLTKGNTQTLGGLIVPGGSLQLVLQTDCTIIATPFGQVLSGIPKRFSFDSTGNLLGTCQIWSNAELSPSTGYLVNFYDADGARINANPFVWVFSQTIGQSVDIGTMVSTGTSGPSYSGAVLLNPPSPQSGNINVAGVLTLTGTITLTGNETISGTLTAGSFTNNLSAFAATTSAQLAGIISDEVGSGPLAFATNTPLTNPTIDVINQKTATLFSLKDNTGGTRFSIPSGGVTASTLNNTNVTGGSTLTSPTVLTGITPGSGLKHQRFGASCTTAASVGSACATAYSWSGAFADANYTVSCYGTLASGSPILTYSSKTASQISIGVAAGSAAAAQFAAVDCIAIHD